MKPSHRKFIAGGVIMLALFLLVILWATVPFGGETLPQRIQALFDKSFVVSAMVVSVVSAILGTAAVLFATVVPASAANRNR